MKEEIMRSRYCKVYNIRTIFMERDGKKQKIQNKNELKETQYQVPGTRFLYKQYRIFYIFILFNTSLVKCSLIAQCCHD
jgi:hypothetical protein